MGLLDDRQWPSPAAWSAEPLTAEEIDVHPDSARIWATILSLRTEIEPSERAAFEEGQRYAQR